MLTSAECQQMARDKLAQAEHEPLRRIRLLTSSEGWSILENQLRRLEADVARRVRFHSAASARGRSSARPDA